MITIPLCLMWKSKLVKHIKLELILLIWAIRLLVTGKYGINEINKKFGKKYQMLSSSVLKFNFKSDSGILNDLNGRCFVLPANKDEA